MDTFVDLPLVAVDNTASTVTVSKNTKFIEEVRPLNATESANALYTGANAAVYAVHNATQYPNSTSGRVYYTSATVAAVKAAAASGAVGGGVSGDATLVAGTVTVAIPGVTTASKFVLTRHTAGGTVTSTVEYFYVVSAGSLVITAAVAAGTINSADTSVITYALVG